MNNPIDVTNYLDYPTNHESTSITLVKLNKFIELAPVEQNIFFA
jgi:hypothetical protein